MVESAIDKGFGVGAFILRNGNDVVYVPTIMVAGKIESCETVYNKHTDSIIPLDKDTAKTIVDSKYTTDPKLVKDVRTEDTTTVFKNMFRPPMSSNPLMLGYYNQSMPVTAGSTDISVLPNIYKQAVVKTLTDNPHILQKIAEFYPIDSLIEKLANTKEDLPTVKYSEDIFSVVKLDELTEKTAAALSASEKEEMLKDGYVLKYAEDLEYSNVTPVTTFASDMVSRLNLTQLGLNENNSKRPVGTGKLLRLSGTDVLQDFFIDTGCSQFVSTPLGLKRIEYAQSFVVKDYTAGIKARDLLALPGATVADEFADTGQQCAVFVPTGKGYCFGTFIERGSTVTDDNNSVMIGDNVVLVPHLNKGCVKLNSITYCPLKGSIIVPVMDDYKSANVYIQNVGQAYNIFKKLHTTVKLVTDNIQWHVKTSANDNVNTFNNKADCVSHLVKAYALSKEAVDLLFTDKQVLLLEKKSFTATEQQQPLPAQQDNTAMPQANPEVIEAAADIADPQVLDTGIIASLASNPDIKLQLVDLLPTFEDTVTKIGKAILLFTTAAEELEKNYGKEQYTLLLKSLRTVFNTLGNIVVDLKKYINFN